MAVVAIAPKILRVVSHGEAIENGLGLRLGSIEGSGSTTPEVVCPPKKSIRTRSERQLNEPAAYGRRQKFHVRAGTKFAGKEALTIGTVQPYSTALESWTNDVLLRAVRGVRDKA